MLFQELSKIFLPTSSQYLSINHLILSNINNFTSDNLYLKATLDLSFIPSNLFPGLIAGPEWMVVPPVFAADIPVGPSRRTIGS